MYLQTLQNQSRNSSNQNHGIFRFAFSIIFAYLLSLGVFIWINIPVAHGASGASYGAPPDAGQTDDPLVDTISYSGTVYYIDCDGNDTNDGLTPATAWQTTTKVNTKTRVGYWDTVAPNTNTNPANHAPWTAAPSGSAFLFKRGCTFDGFISVHGGISFAPNIYQENVTFGAYGSRALPRPKIQYITPSTLYMNSVWNNGHKISVRNLDFDGSGTTNSIGISLTNSNDCTIYNTVINNVQTDGITADNANNLLIENTTISNSNQNGGRGGGFAGGHATNLRILNSTFINNGLDQIGTHNIYIRDLTNSVIDGNLLQGGSNQGVVLHGDSTNVRITNNDVFGNSNGIGVDIGYAAAETFSGITIANNRIHDNGYRPGEQGYAMLLGSLVYSTVTNNIIYGNRLGGIILADRTAPDASSNHVGIYNNTFSDTNGFQLVGSGLTFIDIKNNIFQTRDTTSALRISTGIPNSAYTADNDLYHSLLNNTGTVIRNNVTNYSLGTFFSTFNQESSGLYGIPFFQNSALFDFQLLSTSPLIDAGSSSATGAGIDFLGNPIYGTPDIGAYEYQPPHRVGIDKVDISAGARIYGDGKFRDLLVVGSGVADLSVMPASGSFPLFNATDTRPEWMDISITTWSNTGTYYKEWIESSTIGSIPTLHTIGDLKANTSYIVVVDGTGSSIVGTGSTICSSGNCMSDASGSMMFIYTGGYSTHTFTITEGVQGDTTPPVITLIGSGVVNVLRGSTFVDGGATWIDTVDGSGAILSATSGSVDTNVLGSYTLTYSHTDVAGNTGSTNRSVNVITGNIPVITLIGSGTITVPFGSNYIDAGATATDLEDGNLTSSIVVNNTVNTGAIGLYTVTYDVTDTQMNQAVRVTRMVNVVTGAAPVITLIGSGTITVPFGSGYTDLGATASDLEDGNLTSSIVVNNTVNTGAIGLYTVTYDVTDAQTNQAVRVTRVVNVVDTTPPVITLIGSGVVNIYQNGSYVDSGATWTDIVDGGGTISSATSGSVNVFLTGTYTLSYTHTDVAGNTGIPVTRVVNVIPVVSTGSTSSGSTGTGSTGTGSTGTGSTGSGSTGTGTTGTGSTGTGSTGTGTTGTGSTGTGSTGSGSTGTGIITSTSPTVSPNFSGPGGGGGGGGGSSSTTSSNDNSSSNRNSTVTLSSAPVKSSLSTLSGSIIPVLSLQSYTSLSVQEATRVSTEYKESIDSLITNVESSNMRPMHVRAQQYIYGTFIGIWRDIARSSNPTGYRDAAIYLCRGMKQMSTSNIEINILNTFLRNIDTYVRL